MQLVQRGHTLANGRHANDDRASAPRRTVGEEALLRLTRQRGRGAEQQHEVAAASVLVPAELKEFRAQSLFEPTYSKPTGIAL